MAFERARDKSNIYALWRVNGKVDATIHMSGAQPVITDAMGRPWLARFRNEHGGKAPVVIVGNVRNITLEHINALTFVKDLERALVNSGEVDFVASAAERQDLRSERIDQAGNASEETAKEHGRETGADFMLIGTINAIQDREGSVQVIFYQVNLELVHIETNRKVWIGDKKSKKVVKQKRFGL